MLTSRINDSLPPAADECWGFLMFFVTVTGGQVNKGLCKSKKRKEEKKGGGGHLAFLHTESSHKPTLNKRLARPSLPCHIFYDPRFVRDLDLVTSSDLNLTH